MGKQTTNILKSKAEKLYTMHTDKFSEDFENNKKVLSTTGVFDYSKTDRNIVAGYISRLVIKEKKKDD